MKEKEKEREKNKAWKCIKTVKTNKCGARKLSEQKKNK